MQTFCSSGWLLTEPSKITYAFAINFRKACSNNNETCNQDLKNKFHAGFSQYHSACEFSTVSVEVVGTCIRKMKHGKAPGLDRIQAEHLVHAHPRLCAFISSFQPDAYARQCVLAKFGLGLMIQVSRHLN